MNAEKLEKLGLLLSPPSKPEEGQALMMELMAEAGIPEGQQPVKLKALRPLLKKLGQGSDVGPGDFPPEKNPFNETEWHALFQAKPIQLAPPLPESLLGRALVKAASEVGVLEWPAFSNSSPRIDTYLGSTGTELGQEWCMSFIYWCVNEVAPTGKNHLRATASCIKQWEHAQNNKKHFRCVTAKEAQATPNLITPGAIFIHRYDKDSGHAGFVQSVGNEFITTIEGNANPMGLSSVGMGAYQRKRQPLSNPESTLLGFILLNEKGTAPT